MTQRAVLALALALQAVGCANPPPRCATRGESYETCSDNGIWQCPTGPADVVAFNLAVDAACETEDDPVQCVLEADYQYVEMTFRQSCGDQVCVDQHGGGATAASCEDPP